MYTALRTFCPLRPTRFGCEAMTFPEMTVRAMDEILLRIEISGRGGGGIQRATFKRARRGYGRDKRGPPAQEEGRRDSARDVQTGPAWVRPRQARPSRSGRGEEGFSARRPNGPGVGTAATSAALPPRKNRDKGVNGEWAAFWRLASKPPPKVWYNLRRD